VRKYNSTRKRTAIPKKSHKKAKYDKKYSAIRKEFLAKNSNCAVYPHRKATEVHHKKGRQHDIFADDWARENDIPLLVDVRFFLAVSREGHNEIEEHPNWAKKKGFSLDRQQTE